jgi:UDP-hydrolysing UDP-N-acetyl-D-glucosamine 2-epimerase
MKKVCVVTATRSEYGLMRWIIDAIHQDEELELQLVVTGAHLSPEQGLTYKFIEEDGYPIAAKVPMLLTGNDEICIAKSMGLCSISLADVYKRLNPELVIVLGDRYELLPIVGTALVMRIPVAHIAGGDVTEGAIDDEVRNAVTMMSSIHFPGVIAAGDNIHRMLGTNKNVYVVGEVGLDSFYRLDLWDKIKTAKNLDLDLSRKWCLVTLHSETKLSLDENLQMVDNLFNAIKCVEGVQYIVTKANTDFGGLQINEYWEKAILKCPQKMQLYPSLGQHRYLSFMKHADMVVGNSSSGIVEAPFLGTPVVNIGDRQKGRYVCKSVICCGRSENEISEALNKAMDSDRIIDKYWGDGHSSERIVEKIKEYLNA